MTSDLFDLTGRTALVTGGGQGVGRGIAQTLAAHGAKVAVNDFFAERAETVAGEITAEGRRALGVAADVSDFDGVMAMVARIERELGPIDILVNNAGNGGPHALATRLNFWETPPEAWDAYMKVNLRGVMVCARACTPGMVGRRYGRVITIVSDAGRSGEQGQEAYSAAKAGAAGFSRALARSLGRFGVTVNAISLASMERETWTATPESAAILSRMMKHYIVRRQGRPADVAAVALLLASEASSWITGQTYPVNGGFTMAL